MQLNSHTRLAGLCVLAIAMSGCSIFRSNSENSKPPVTTDNALLPAAVNNEAITVGNEGPLRCSDSELARLFAGVTDPAQKAVLALRIYHFKLDNADLNTEATNSLSAHAKIISKHPEIRLMVTGHTDERGTHDYNIALGERRANSVARYLSSVGVNGDQLKVTSYGKEKPIAMGSNEAAWAQNRRAELDYMGCK